NAIVFSRSVLPVADPVGVTRNSMPAGFEATVFSISKFPVAMSGGLSPPNPRPAANFNQVIMVENFTKSWYDAVETQLLSHLGWRGSLRVSYPLSRSYLDGVDFFTTLRGTQRTPHERGYNPSDQRHNLTVASTVALPC